MTFMMNADFDDPNAPMAPGGPEQPDTASQATTSVLERTEEQKSPGDDERYAHYVRSDRLTKSLIEGGPVVALCGKVWTPVRNPDKYPICPTCKEIHEHLGSGDGVWPFGPNAPK